ncbi:MAG: hypothetical protein COW67_06640 [Flavobacteriales bacterium CG18_big_fil_WC_8_21_14_2_50_32_9]|nr:MAG: hypothetical protein COW67_06640 [Flavobacteriales bacterium CG18_big_fil_WC_8_21_14_2_50_32_9]
MRAVVILFVVVFIQYGCVNHKNDQLDGLDTLNATTDTVNEIEPIVETAEIMDTIQQDTTERTPKTKQHKTSLEEIIEVEAKEVPIDPYLNDPMNRPGYVGTPCEEDETGKCFRHDHNTNPK